MPELTRQCSWTCGPALLPDRDTGCIFWECKFVVSGAIVGRTAREWSTSRRAEPLSDRVGSLHVTGAGPNPAGGAQARGLLQSGSRAELIPKGTPELWEFPSGLRAWEEALGLIRHLVSFSFCFRFSDAARRK